MKNLIWVGARESDIVDCQDQFDGSITIYGSNQNGNVSFCAMKGKRVNHNLSDSVSSEFWRNNIESVLKQNPEAKFMFYNSILAYDLFDDVKSKNCICLNSLSLLNLLNNKADMRQIVSKLNIPTVPFVKTINENILSSFTDGFIFQLNASSGGFGTYLFHPDAQVSFSQFIDEHSQYFVSPYFQYSIPVNLHFMISNNEIIPFPGSVQIIEESTVSGYTKLLYIGADFITYDKLPKDKVLELTEFGFKISKYLQHRGYRGIIGYDFLLCESQTMFLEANGRFQASTPLLNIALKKQNISIQKMQLQAFNDEFIKPISPDSSVDYSFISYLSDMYPFSIIKYAFDLVHFHSIHFDGFNTNTESDEKSYAFKLVLNTNVTSVSSEYTVLLHPNLFRENKVFYKGIIDHNPLCLKIALLNQGINVRAEILNRDNRWRKAVFDAYDIILENGMRINCPNHGKFQQLTPWNIRDGDNGKLVLQYEDFQICLVEIDSNDDSSSKITSLGLPYSEVAMLTTDRLRIHHGQSCMFKLSKRECLFCNMEEKTTSIQMDDIREVIDYYETSNVDFRHYLIGGGSQPNEVLRIVEIANFIRTKSNKPIYVMCLPVTDASLLKKLKESGVTEIAFNIEVFDDTIASIFMPGKGMIPRKVYFDALKKAAEIWGKGNVRSLAIIGLEPKSKFIEGIESLCRIGVMPIISVFRPLAYTPMQDFTPPSNKELYHMYQKCEEICNRYHLFLGPDCEDCQNNTLALPLHFRGERIKIWS